MTPGEIIQWPQLVVTVFLGIIGSGGLWAYLQRKFTNNTAERALLLGLAHDRIIARGMNFIERGWLSIDEYEDFVLYLWGPYSEFGGNGLAQRVKDQVDELEVRRVNHDVIVENREMYK